VDVNQDGVDEVVAMTMFGVHVLQPNVASIQIQAEEALALVDVRSTTPFLVSWTGASKEPV